MIRTNLYFPKQLHQKLEHLAKQERISMAQLVREFVKRGLEEKKGDARILLDMVKNAKPSRVGDLAQRHDYYLYGKGRKNG